MTVGMLKVAKRSDIEPTETGLETGVEYTPSFVLCRHT